MKKLLIILPLLFTAAFAQTVTHKKQTKVKAKTNQTTTKETAGTLEGKSFLVTFKEVNQDLPAGSVNDRNDMSSGNKSNEKMTPHANGMSEDQAMHKMKGIFHFENGMLKSSVFSNQQLTNCMYKVTSYSTDYISFTSRCNEGKETGSTSSSGNAAGTTVNDNATGNTPSSGTGANKNLSGTLGQQSQQTTGLPEQPNNADQIRVDESMNKKVEGNSKSLYSSASISGVVNGTSISGTLTWYNHDGHSMKYTYTGTRTNKTENTSGEIGLKQN